MQKRDSVSDFFYLFFLIRLVKKLFFIKSVVWLELISEYLYPLCAFGLVSKRC